jgi:hypothetical protein
MARIDQPLSPLDSPANGAGSDNAADHVETRAVHSDGEGDWEAAWIDLGGEG